MKFALFVHSKKIAEFSAESAKQFTRRLASAISTARITKPTPWVAELAFLDLHGRWGLVLRQRGYGGPLALKISAPWDIPTYAPQYYKWAILTEAHYRNFDAIMEIIVDKALDVGEKKSPTLRIVE